MALIGAKRALLGEKKPKWLLRDYYPTAIAAGSVDGTRAEPGGGFGSVAQNTRNVVDTGSVLSNTDGKSAAASGTDASDPLLYYGGMTREAGLTAKWEYKTSGRGGCGWSIAAAPPNSRSQLGITDYTGVLTATPLYLNYPLYSTNTDYTFWATLFSIGGVLWIQGGAYTNPTLLWIDDIYNQTPMYFFQHLPRTNAYSGIADNTEICRIPSLSTQQKISNVYITNPVNGVNYGTTADAIHYLTFTLPGAPADGEIIELRYRYQDVNNYWTAYVIYDDGDGEWNFMLDEVTTGGGVINKITVDTDIGAAVSICVIVTGDTHDCFTRVANTWTKRGAQITDASLNTATEVGAWYLVGACSLLRSFRKVWNL